MHRTSKWSIQPGRSAAPPLMASGFLPPVRAAQVVTVSCDPSCPTATREQTPESAGRTSSSPTSVPQSFSATVTTADVPAARSDAAHRAVSGVADTASCPEDALRTANGAPTASTAATATSANRRLRPLRRSAAVLPSSLVSSSGSAPVTGVIPSGVRRANVSSCVFNPSKSASNRVHCGHSIR